MMETKRQRKGKVHKREQRKNPDGSENIRCNKHVPSWLALISTGQARGGGGRATKHIKRGSQES